MAQINPLESFDIKGRTAIITGGSRGLGRAMAEGFSELGANVVIASRKADACESLAESINASGGSALAVPTHLGEFDQFGPLVEKTLERFGGIDILVNNAANALAQNMGEMTPEAWSKAHSVNLHGPALLIQEALPELERSDQGSVINVITAGAFMGAAGISIYTSAKAGLWNFTKSMSKELAPRGIRVNAIAPGPFDTDMVQASGPDAAEGMGAATTLGRLADPAEIVPAALFLASPASSYVTGSVIVVDGGLLA